ncbi:hypothetical protein K439DRAFT_1619768 [Ramaria rubella]|nr:hypothetical protein K439DRAFT_1619768 [Ramaria rubella]
MDNSQLQGLMWRRCIPVLLLQDRRSLTNALVENGGLSFDLDYFFGYASIPGWLPFLPTAPQHLRYLLTLEPQLSAGFFKDKHTVLRFDMDGKYIWLGKDTTHDIYMAFICLMSQRDNIDFLVPLGSRSPKPMSALRRTGFFVFLSVAMMLAGVIDGWTIDGQAMPPPNQPWTTDSVKAYTTLPSVASLDITYAQAITVNYRGEASSSPAAAAGGGGKEAAGTAGVGGTGGGCAGGAGARWVRAEPSGDAVGIAGVGCTDGGCVGGGGERWSGAGRGGGQWECAGESGGGKGAGKSGCTVGVGRRRRVVGRGGRRRRAVGVRWGKWVGAAGARRRDGKRTVGRGTVGGDAVGTGDGWTTAESGESGRDEGGEQWVYGRVAWGHDKGGGCLGAQDSGSAGE